MIFVAYEPAAGSSGSRYIWIDLVDDVTWHHSGQTATFTNWEEDEPTNNNPSTGCTIMKPYGMWNDRPCHKVYGFLCERE